MAIFSQLKSHFIRKQYAKITHDLSVKDPKEFIATGERNLLKAFQSAAEQVPAYRQLLREKGVTPSAITSVEVLKAKVPIINKDMVFPNNELRSLCAGGHLDDICSIYSSSGHSGVFSFGVQTWKNASNAAIELEYVFDLYFNIFSRKTLLINCLPMGVKIPTRTLPVAETSVRADVIHALIIKLAKEFDQFILVGESPFLKKVIEEGAETDIPWPDLIVHVITGGEFIAENYRSYLGHLLGIDFENPEGGMITINMGLSELSLSIFREQPQTIALRRLAHSDPKVRYELFGVGVEICPLIMQYSPQSTYLETDLGPGGSPELVVSILDKAAKIPLIRYNTGDTARILTYNEMKGLLESVGLAEFLPEFKLPFGLVWGKKLAVTSKNEQSLSVHEVKEALYRDFKLAGRVTGNFHIAEGDEGVTLLVQLKAGFAESDDMQSSFAESLKIYNRTGVDINFVPYREFPYGIEHNFEIKNKYI